MTLNKHVIGIVILSLLFFSFPVLASDYTIDSNSVYIDDSNIYLSAEPHTLTESGYVYYNLTSKHFTGDIDICFGFNTLQCRPKSAEIWLSGSWIDVSDHFTSINYNYDNLNKWYYITDLPITANVDYTLRVYQQINEISTGGKYGVAVKPSFETISQAINNGHFYYLDPWWNGSYDYRKEITLTGGASGAQTDYQLLLNITYDADIQTDFDDLRFSNDTHQIDAWLEDKVNSNYANIWVEFPTTPANGINQTYYMYYGNNDISNDWNGTNTFLQYHGATSNAFLDAATVSPTNVIYEAKVKTLTTPSIIWGLSNTVDNTDDDMYIYSADGGLRYIITHNEGTHTLLSEPSAFTNDIWYKLKITYDGSTIYGYVDGNEIDSGGIATNLPNENLGLHMRHITGSGEQEWSFARKYAANPPTYFFGDEETEAITITATITPETLSTTVMGNVSISYLIEHSTPLNLSSLACLVGINDTDDNTYQTKIRVPSNNISAQFLTHGHILRNLNRNMSLSWENNDTITEGNVYKWGGFDNDNYQVSTTVINATHTYINVTEHSNYLHPGMVYLGQHKIVDATKTQVAIDRSQSIITKIWDLSLMHSWDRDYIIKMFFDSYLDYNALPNDDIIIWYCNNSFDPNNDDFQNCEYCSQLTILNYTQWDNDIWTPSAHASYCNPLTLLITDYTDPLPDTQNYICYSSNTVSAKPFYLNMTNTDPEICNLTFAETNTSWLQNELSHVQTSYAYTPNCMYLYNRANQTFDYHLWVADTEGAWLHSDIFSENIIAGNFDPTNAIITYFNVTDGISWCKDYDMDGTYDSGELKMNLVTGNDPDGGIVIHNITLCYVNGTHVAVINNTIPDVQELEITWDPSPYYSTDDYYTIKLNVTDDEGNRSTRFIGSYFSLAEDGSTGFIMNDYVSFWGYTNISELYVAINNSSLLSYNAPTDTYTMHVPFYKSKCNDTFTIDHDVHLKSNNDGNEAYFKFTSRVYINDSSISSWDIIEDDYAPHTDTQRAYIVGSQNALGGFYNSDLSYLGSDIYRQEGINLIRSNVFSIDNCTLSYNSRGILSEDTNAQITITDCTINNNEEAGIGVYFTNNSILFNNTIKDNGRTGIRIYDGNNHQMNNNTITGSGYYAYWLQHAENNSIQNNSCSDSTLGDIRVSSYSLDNTLSDSIIEGIISVTSSSTLNIENTDNMVFADTSASTTTYAYPTNFSMFISNETVTTQLTNYDMWITPNSDKLEINDITWVGGYYQPVTVNTTSSINITSVYFNITNPGWIQLSHGNNITISRDNIVYSTDYFANEYGTLSYEYVDGYSSHKFDFRLTFTDEDLTTYAKVKTVLKNTLATLQTFVDNVLSVIPFIIGGFVILFIIMIAGAVTSMFKRW